MTVTYDIHGTGDAGAPTVLLSSGLGGAAAYWRAQIAGLVEAGYRVLAYDQRGTGRSAGALPADYAIAHMAADVIEILDDSHTARCHVVGHALGGLVGLQLALDAPARVASLALVNAWARLSPHTARCFAARLALLHAAGARAYVEAQPLFLYPAAWSAANAALVQDEVDHAFAHFPGTETMLARIGALKAFDVHARLGEIAVPVWVSAARDDLLVPWTSSQELSLGLARATLELAPTGAHAHNVTSPAAFNRGLLAFLAGAASLAPTTTEHAA
ncbi:pyrimidine utilization protein D [Cupriavidus sp. 30B13]|uniref:pyrimidine utilization protein D n=1 Tax=Cupriavidus sp. 30B13 TaxID=3384241 RepID=UPI003B9093F4